jgi:hypothetical protein
MKAEETGSSATSVTIHQNTRRHIPEYAILDKEIHSWYEIVSYFIKKMTAQTFFIVLITSRKYLLTELNARITNITAVRGQILFCCPLLFVCKTYGHKRQLLRAVRDNDTIQMRVNVCSLIKYFLALWFTKF